MAWRWQPFERNNFVVSPDKAVNVPVSTPTEESASELLGCIGLAFESAALRGQDMLCGLRMSLATPLWRRVQNTGRPQAQFSGARGWDWSLEGRYRRAVIPRVHVGVWGKRQTSMRNAQTQGGSLELPTSRPKKLTRGLVVKLKTARRDGTMHLLMSPREFMQRLATLEPKPGLHLLRFRRAENRRKR